jgi:myo-inositol catabolism protein IolS
LIGEVLKETGKRDELIIASKAAHKLVDGKITLDNSRGFMRKSVEESLQRLQIESIDLFYVHFPDGKTPLAEVAGTLNELKNEGKIKAIGLSNVNLEQLKEFNADGYLDALQNNYSLLARDAEKEILPYSAEHSITFIPYFPLASGLLSGKYKPDSVFNDSRAKKPNFQGETYLAILEKVEKLNTIAANKGVETAQLALAWLLTRPAVGAVIPGSKSVDQVLHNRKTLDIVLSADEVQTISDIFQP